MDIELAQTLAENKLLKSLLYCTKRSCNNCGKVTCENFQRQRIDCCGNWVSYKDYIKQLEEELKKWKDEWQEQVQKATDEGYARTLQTIQLTKAKEIIRDFIAVAIDYIDPIDKNYSLIAEAEQFLKDSEVEK